MTEKRFINRRNVLKTIGTGVAGSAMLTGSASASCSEDLLIKMDNNNFHPSPAEISLSGSFKRVTWKNIESGFHPHDVNIGHSSMTMLSDAGDFSDGENEVNSPFFIVPGGTYCVKLKDDGQGSLVVKDSNETAKVPWSSGSVELEVHCDHHSNMEGTLIVSK